MIDTIVPAPGKVFVRELEQENPSALAVFTNVPQRIVFGEVVAVGGEIQTNKGRVPNDVEKGDKVVFERFTALPTKINDENYLIVMSQEILAKI